MSKIFARSILWLTLSEIIFNVAGYVIHSAVGRILGPSEYGRYSIIIALTTTVVILIGNGIPTAMSKYISEIYDTKPESVHSIKKETLKLQCIIIGVVTVLFFLLAPFTAFLLGDTSLTPLFRLSSLIIPAFAAASFYFSYYTGLHKFNVQAVLKVTRSFARVIFIISLAYFFGVNGTVYGYILAPLTVFVIAFLVDKMLYAKEPWQVDIAKTPFNWRKLVDFAWPITLFMLFYELLISIDLFLVKRILHDDFATGIYNSALTIGRLPYFLFYALTIVLFPALSNASANGNASRMKSIVSQSIRLQMFILIPVATLMIAYAQPIVTLFYGDRFFSAVEPFRILTVGASFLTIFYVMSFALGGVGKVKIPMILSGIGLFIITVLGFATIPLWGLHGAAWSTTLVSTLLAMAILYFVHKQFKTPIPFKDTALCLLASFILFFITRLLPHNGLWFLLFGPFLLGVYFCFLHFSKILKDTDTAPFLSIFRKSKSV